MGVSGIRSTRKLLTRKWGVGNRIVLIHCSGRGRGSDVLTIFPDLPAIHFLVSLSGPSFGFNGATRLLVLLGPR